MLWADIEDSGDEALRGGEADMNACEAGSSSAWSSASSEKLQQIRTLSNESYRWCTEHDGWPKKSCRACRRAVRALFSVDGGDQFGKMSNNKEAPRTPPTKRRKDVVQPGAPRKAKKRFLARHYNGVPEVPDMGGLLGAVELRDGEAVCDFWNKGSCHYSKDCPFGKHVCNSYTSRDGRVCGMHNHNRRCCWKYCI